MQKVNDLDPLPLSNVGHQEGAFPSATHSQTTLSFPGPKQIPLEQHPLGDAGN